MNLAENLKKIRKDNNLSQEQLAEQLGVSRQSVSKWESGQAYPEMDKVLQLAKMFNLNIDDLLNQDIREVNSEKQSKVAINKYIDDFLAFITKTIDMFSSMKLKDRCKCLFEQFIIICLLALLFFIVGSIGYGVLSGIVSMFPQSIINIILSICSSIYLIFAFVLAVILLIHIFKVRYLDYYVIVKEDITTEEDNGNKVEKENIKRENINEDQKVYLEKKKEKVIIRDPRHSEYRFISGMLKILLFFVKCFALIMALTLCISLFCFVLSLVFSFVIVKTGLFFFGIFLALLACVIMNIIVLLVLFNFVINKKSHKKYLLASFLISVLLLGVGVGLGTIGFTSFNYIDDIDHEIYLEDELIVPMKDDLIIHDNHDYFGDYIEYVEEDRNDIRIIYKHTKYFKLYTENFDNYMYIGIDYANNNFLAICRESIKDMNDKKIINYSKSKIYIYTSRDNIEKLKNNRNNYLRQLEEEENYYNELLEENSRYEDRIYELEEEIEMLESELELYDES